MDNKTTTDKTFIEPAKLPASTVLNYNYSPKEPVRETFVLYHANCLDGFMSAVIAYKALQSQAYPPMHPIHYIPLEYKTKMPSMHDADVIMLDYSVSRKQLKQIAKYAHSVLIIDHHKTAIERLAAPIPKVEMIFDINQCGATLAWDYFFPDVQQPELLKYIRDYDLYTHTLQETRYIVSKLETIPNVLPLWVNILNLSVDMIVAVGQQLHEAKMYLIQEHIKQAKVIRYIDGHKVAIVNAPRIWRNETAELILDKDSTIDFVITYYRTDFTHDISLRSRIAGLDVAKLAETYGGGGHRTSSGIKESILSPKFYNKYINLR